MDRSLISAYSCVDQMATALQGVGRKLRTRLAKSIKMDQVWARKVQHFKCAMSEVRNNWSKIVREVFQVIDNVDVLDELAEHMIRSFIEISEKSDIDEEHKRLLIKGIVIPIIGAIMDERDLSPNSKQLQDKRKQFLYKLASASQVGSGDSILAGGSQFISSAELPNQTRNLNLSMNTQSIQTVGSQQQNLRFDDTEYPNWISELVLEVIFEAITRHSQNVASKDADMVAQIYHIMNITYIVDILARYLENINSKQRSVGDRIRLRPENVESYKENISNNLRLLNIDHPLSVFRKDLTTLLCQIRAMRQQRFGR